MSAERPSFEPKNLQSASWALPESFRKAVDEMKPDGLDWNRIEAAMAVLKGEKEAIVPSAPAPKPTERQLFWRDMYRTGKLSPYQKERPRISLSAIAEAWRNPQSQGETSRIMAVDLAIRGGADKEYNQLGPTPRRLKRMAVMVGNIVPFWTFDVVTSVPAELVEKAIKLKFGEKTNSLRVQGIVEGAKKIIEVQNDKVVTALGDILVKNLTGEKGAWIHEAADKSADLLQSAYDDLVHDAVDGPVLESGARFIFQIPVLGALVEQGITRLSMLQEKSPLNKGIGKSFYMGLGLCIGVWRGLRSKEKPPKKAPSAKIANMIWPYVRFLADKNYHFMEFVDTGRPPRWMKGQDMTKSIWEPAAKT